MLKCIRREYENTIHPRQFSVVGQTPVHTQTIDRQIETTPTTQRPKKTWDVSRRHNNNKSGKKWKYKCKENGTLQKKKKKERKETKKEKEKE